MKQNKTCWRNMRLGGAAVDASSKDPTQWELPSEGELTLDFVSFKVYSAPQPGMDQEGSSVPPSPASSRGPALSVSPSRRAPESPSGSSADRASPSMPRALTARRGSQEPIVEVHDMLIGHRIIFYLSPYLNRASFLTVHAPLRSAGFGRYWPSNDKRNGTGPGRRACGRKPQKLEGTWNRR